MVQRLSSAARLQELLTSPDTHCMSNGTLDALFNDDELARGNMSGTREYQQLDT